MQSFVPFEQADIGPDLLRAARRMGLEGLEAPRPTLSIRTAKTWGQCQEPQTPSDGAYAGVIPVNRVTRAQRLMRAVKRLGTLSGGTVSL